MKKFFLAALAAASVILTVPAAEAAPIFVGSWTVDQGPHWSTQPLAYTGQEAAALLFGGLASDYAISTIDNNPGTINFEAWYSILGIGGGTQFAQNYVAPASSQAPGFYYSGASYPFLATDAASAYVDDNAIGAKYTNFAFRITDVPEPLTLSLFGVGAMGVAAMRRRSKAQKA
ncbi:MAG TPA: PEP-CTERM sorting domain-containing protein [Rhizomicrobium sp.]|nr:PEP-CTERM sorting domain-containing protein [Rhizomicrobium sp.]